jgi:hypothetical protein
MNSGSMPRSPSLGCEFKNRKRKKAFIDLAPSTCNMLISAAKPMRRGWRLQEEAG